VQARLPARRPRAESDLLLTWRLAADPLLHMVKAQMLLCTQARDFRLVGPAHESDLLPAWRLAAVDPERNSQLYMKRIEAPVSNMREPGKRIGW
jgi:hypothetical protein